MHCSFSVETFNLCTSKVKLLKKCLGGFLNTLNEALILLVFSPQECQKRLWLMKLA